MAFNLVDKEIRIGEGKQVVLREERLAHNHFCPHDVPSFERARQIVDFMQVVAPQNIEVLFDEEGGDVEKISGDENKKHHFIVRLYSILC